MIYLKKCRCTCKISSSTSSVACWSILASATDTMRSEGSHMERWRFIPTNLVTAMPSKDSDEVSKMLRVQRTKTLRRTTLNPAKSTNLPYQLTHSMDFEIPTIWTDLIPNSLLSFSSPSGNVFWAHFTEPRLKSCREGWLKLCQRLWRYDLKQINTYCITEINKIKRFCLTDPHPPSPPMEPQSFETHHSSTILRQQWYLEKIPSIPRGWEQKKTQPGVQSQWQEFWIKAF